jgi:carboxymethylenebutenolidase
MRVEDVETCAEEIRMQTEITTERVQVDVSDGTKMDAYLARPSGRGRNPGLLVFQEIFGVNAHIRDIAERFARQGYAALAPDLFHRTAPGYDGKYEDPNASIAVAMKYGPEQSHADIKAAYELLRDMSHVEGDRIAAVGFCMGGRLAFTADALLPLRAAVSFYGAIGDKLELAKQLSGPILFFWAGKDHYIPVEQHRAVSDELRRLGKPFINVEFSACDHGFFCDARSNYDANAAAQSWPLTLAFLRSHVEG